MTRSAIRRIAEQPHHTAISSRHFRAAARHGSSDPRVDITVPNPTSAATATQATYPSKPTPAVDVVCAMPWKASRSRPTGSSQSTLPASSVEPPRRTMDNRAAG